MKTLTAKSRKQSMVKLGFLVILSLIPWKQSMVKLGFLVILSLIPWILVDNLQETRHGNIHGFR
jgi:hypothetical protein